MLIKSIMALSLIISFVLLVGVGFQSPVALQGTTDVAKVKDKKTADRAWGEVKLYPAVPRSLPDFYNGYLFNEERLLIPEEDIKEEEGSEAHQGIRVNMDEVTYVGSLIIGDTRKGLISFPNKPQPVKSARSKTAQRSRKKVARRVIKKRNYAQVLVGETFSDYKVVAVESDRIEFSKSGKTIVKQLYDPDKKRLTLPKIAGTLKKRSTINKSAVKKKKAVVLKRKRVKIGTTEDDYIDLEHGFPPPDLSSDSRPPIRNKGVIDNSNSATKKPAISILPKPKL